MSEFLMLCLFIIFLSLLSMSPGFIGALACAFLPIVAALGASLMMIQVLSMPLQNRNAPNLAVDGGEDGERRRLNVFIAAMGFMQGLLVYTFHLFYGFYRLLGRLVGWAAPALGRAPPPPLPPPVVFAPEVVWPQEGVQARQPPPPAAPQAVAPAAPVAPPPQAPAPEHEQIHIHIHIPLGRLAQGRGRRGRGAARRH